MDLLHNNNFTDHNVLFKFYGIHSLQVLIPLGIYSSIITKFLKLSQENKNESYLSTIKFLPKRNDFIYEIEDHVAIDFNFLKRNKYDNQGIYIKKFIDLIIKNKCQLVISKENLLNKDDCEKIFPKIKEFRKIKNEFDKNYFFSSSYYERVIK